MIAKWYPDLFMPPPVNNMPGASDPIDTRKEFADSVLYMRDFL
jgi:hypothetical protein